MAIRRTHIQKEEREWTISHSHEVVNKWIRECAGNVCSLLTIKLYIFNFFFPLAIDNVWATTPNKIPDPQTIADAKSRKPVINTQVISGQHGKCAKQIAKFSTFSAMPSCLSVCSPVRQFANANVYMLSLECNWASVKKYFNNVCASNFAAAFAEI